MPVSSRVVGRLGSGMAPWPVDRLGLGLGLVFVSILCDCHFGHRFAATWRIGFHHEKMAMAAPGYDGPWLWRV